MALSGNEGSSVAKRCFQSPLWHCSKLLHTRGEPQSSLQFTTQHTGSQARDEGSTGIHRARQGATVISHSFNIVACMAASLSSAGIADKGDASRCINGSAARMSFCANPVLLSMMCRYGC